MFVTVLFFGIFGLIFYPVYRMCKRLTPVPVMPHYTSANALPIRGLDIMGLVAEAHALERKAGLIPTVKKVVAPVAAAVASVLQAVDVFFRDGEPKTLREYAGQEHIVQFMQAAVAEPGPKELALAYPHMFLGLPGLGKTLLMRVIAHEMQLRAQRLGLPPVQYFEVFPADIPDVDRLDEIIQRCHDNPGCVLSIDEIHDLTEKHCRKLYEVLANHRYQFKGAAHPIVLNPFTLLAATTDYGALHPALKRRWKQHHVHPVQEAQILEMLLMRPVDLDVEAAKLIVSRTKFSGAPWEAFDLLRGAITLSKARSGPAVEERDVYKLFELDGIDELGLKWLDRRIIEALLTSPRYRMQKGVQTFVCYGASEQDTCMLAGVDKGEYRDVIFPKLLSRGLMMKRPTYGQTLTPLAVQLYGKATP